MLRRAKDLEHYKLRASDGDIGKVNQFYFDDRYWTVRYLVAKTGNWLTGRQVLLAPHALKPADEPVQVIPVELTKEQIENSPPLDQSTPISRAYELQYFQYFGWPYYGQGSYLWGPATYLSKDAAVIDEPTGEDEPWDPDIRGTSEVTGYKVIAGGKDVGYVADFLIDDENWMIRYLVIDSGLWISGRKTLISPEWIERMSWSDSEVLVDLPSSLIESAPEYDPETFDRSYESSLYNHYGRPGYWEMSDADWSASLRVRVDTQAKMI